MRPPSIQSPTEKYPATVGYRLFKWSGVVVFLFATISFGCVAAWLWFTSNEELTAQIANWLHAPHRLEKLRTEILPPTRQSVLAGLMALGMLFSLIVGYVHWRTAPRRYARIRQFGNELCSAFRAIRSDFVGLPVGVRVFLLGAGAVWMGLHTYWAITLPLTIDEANVYQEFVQRGLFTSLTYWPIPSNHIFHTAQAAVLHNAFGLGPWGAMRIPVLAFGGIFLITSAFVLTRRLGPWAGALAWGLLTANYLVQHYSMHGRGYIYALWACVVLSEAVWRLHEGRFGPVIQALTVLAVGVGHWAVPSMLYASAPLAMLGLGIVALQPKPLQISQLISVLKVAGASAAWLLMVYLIPFTLGGGAIGHVNEAYAYMHSDSASGFFGFLAQHFPYHAQHWNFLPPGLGCMNTVEPLVWACLALLMSLVCRGPIRFIGLMASLFYVTDWVLLPALSGFFPPEKALMHLAWAHAWVAGGGVWVAGQAIRQFIPRHLIWIRGLSLVGVLSIGVWNSVRLPALNQHFMGIDWAVQDFVAQHPHFHLEGVATNNEAVAVLLPVYVPGGQPLGQAAWMHYTPDAPPWPPLPSGTWVWADTTRAPLPPGAVFDSSTLNSLPTGIILARMPPNL